MCWTKRGSTGQKPRALVRVGEEGDNSWHKGKGAMGEDNTNGGDQESDLGCQTLVLGTLVPQI